ncbi:hypothetical protein MWU61_02845 [Loktanella sp. F6476L]|uniref:hypothetical protein n=1 Tax=Loktanella sp. F6476L TaxID=2926405 RepID=UPI001FF4BA70|nr:hypothetical protein [Loktanella sp. F6476L]MCK0119462.1 hypothetical protein [Loktanella sp. F6476L]
MSDWQTKLLAILHADTDDLGELAKIAGTDPRTFYRGANFRDADLTKQNLLNYDLSDSQIERAEITDGVRAILDLKQELSRSHSPPAEIARLKVELAFALTDEGRRTDNAALFHESIVLGEAAMSNYTAHEAPHPRSVIMGLTSDNYEELAWRAPKKARSVLFDKAIEVQRQSVDLIRTELFQPTWAKMQLRLAKKLLNAATTAYTRSSTLMTETIGVCLEALTIYTPIEFPRERADTQHVMAQALLGLGERRKSSSGRQQLIEATVACNNALSTLDRTTSPFEWAGVMQTRAEASHTLSQRTLGKDADHHRQMALDSIDDALKIFARERELMQRTQATKLRDVILAHT